MGRFLKKLRDIWAHEELRKRLGITFGFILVYRIGSFIVIPGVDSDALQEQMSALGGGGLGSRCWWRSLRTCSAIGLG